MAMLLTLQGPDPGRTFPLLGESTIMGRQSDAAICLSGKAVSRHHAQILRRNGDFLIEDLASSNGTFLNGKRLTPHNPTPLTELDQLQIGSYLFGLRIDEGRHDFPSAEMNLVVRETVSATSVRSSLLGPDSSARLHTVLEITKALARTLDIDVLLSKLIEQVMNLFPQADRALVVLAQGERLDVRAQLSRRPTNERMLPFSRTIVRQALEEGVGLLSDDIKADQRFSPSATITSLDLHSVLCVPMITSEGRRLGVIQVDRVCKGVGFRVDDLQLLTAIASQVTVVLENASLHAERLREERLRREVALAREIQDGFLPDDLEGEGDEPFEILGRVFPAQQVAGDYYDFFEMPENRIAFVIGDVSGKGIPAALFMVACRTLCRHLAKEDLKPAALLTKLNAALADDNPACMFVTLIYGVYDPANGEVIVTSAGHPPPILRRLGGQVEELPVVGGRLLGYPGRSLNFIEHRLILQPGEAIIFYTDGLSEARVPGSRDMFGRERVLDLVRSFPTNEPLPDWAEHARQKVEVFLGSPGLSDDLTLLMLRRRR